MPKKKRAGEIKVSLTDISQKIDLNKYIKDPTPRQKMLFGELAIDEIENRTLDGKNINGAKFTKYSKKYADIKGVAQDNVDMFLKGDMLDSIDIYKGRSKGDTLTIGVKGSKQKKKAHNHMTDQSTENPLPKREFFGLTNDEAERIAKKVKRQTKSTDAPPTSAPDPDSFTLAELRDALASLGITQGE